MGNVIDATPTAASLALLVAELEQRSRIAALECAELRASAAGTERFARVASLARLLEWTQRDVERLRAGVEAIERAERPYPD